MSEKNAAGTEKVLRVNKGLLTAIGCLVFSCVCLWASRTYPNLSAPYMNISASFFPTMVSIIMVLLSVVMLIKAFTKPEICEISPAQQKAYLRGLLAIVVSLVYVLIFKPVGYILSSIVCLFAMMLVFGNRKWVPMAIISVALPILLYMVFYYVLKTNLPAGLLGQIGLIS